MNGYHLPQKYNDCLFLDKRRYSLQSRITNEVMSFSIPDIAILPLRYQFYFFEEVY
jgi:hypothetical protein